MCGPEVLAAKLIADLIGVSIHFAAHHLVTVSTWREALERIGADGKSDPVNFLPPPTVRRSPVSKVEKGRFDDQPGGWGIVENSELLVRRPKLTLERFQPGGRRWKGSARVSPRKVYHLNGHRAWSLGVE